MMKKVWLVLLAVVLVFGSVLLGCGSSGGGGGGDDYVLVPFEFDGPWDDIIQTADTAKVGITGNQVDIIEGGKDPKGTNTTFFINFEDIGYPFNKGDMLVITYEFISVEGGKAVINLKNPKNWSGNFDGVQGADWGIGKGCEYVLGDNELSNYDGPLVKGTYDPATKIGTFEVMAKLLQGNGATGIGFQHNAWASFGPANTYSFKILKIANGANTNEPPPPPPGPPETNGTKLVIKVAGADKDMTLGLVNEAKGSVAGYLNDNSGYMFTYPATGADVNYGNSYAYFKVNLGTDKLNAFEKVTFKYKKIAGDSNHKQVRLVFSDTAFTGWAPAHNAQSESSGDAAEGVDLTITIDRVAASAFDGAEVYVALIPWCNNAAADVATQYVISNITFVKSATAYVPVQISNVISAADVRPPVDKETPKTSFNGVGYTAAVAWTPETDLDEDGNFVFNKEYTAAITLTKKPGYTFAGIAANSFEVDGNAATNIAGTADAATLVVTVTFPPAISGIPEKTVTFTAGDVTAVGSATIEDLVAGGFTLNMTGQYGPFAYFKVKFDDGVTLGDYSKLDITFEGMSGDSGWKKAKLLVSATVPTSVSETGFTFESAQSDNKDGEGHAPAKSSTITDFTKVTTDINLNEVYIAVYFWSGAVVQKISGIKFYN